MPVFARTPIAVVTLCALAACGGGGGDGGSEDAPRPVPGTNGLNYGFPGQDLTEAETVEVTAKAATFQDGLGATVTDVTVTIGDDFVAGDATDRDGTVTIFGETVTITNGQGVLANGQTVRLFFDADQVSDFAGAISLVSYGSEQSPVVADPIDGEQHFVFGFETNPTTINGFTATNTGTVRYSGGFVASGIVLDGATVVGDRGLDVDGTIEIDVDFGDDAASGTVSGSFETDDDPVDFTLVLDPDEISISGTGFDGSLGCAPPLDCGGSEIDADFYGPNADELGGVLALDITGDAGVGDRQFIGAGTFILDR